MNLLWGVLVGLLILLCLYALIPALLTRFFHWGVLWRPQEDNTVVITFDDGPHPQYTPRVLDILATYHIKACFFVIGKQANQHPDIIARILAEGHTLGNHSYSHQFPWLMGPWRTVREFTQTATILQNFHLKPPFYLRPPWGLCNLFTFLALCRTPGSWQEKKMVLWSFMSWDWGKNCTAQTIQHDVLHKLKKSAILIFHDNDSTMGAAPGAPENMLQALPGIIETIQKKGFLIKPLDDLKPKPFWAKNLLRTLWSIWDMFILRLCKIEPVIVQGKESLFRISTKIYRGQTIMLSPQQMLKKGERVIDLHLNNEQIANILHGETKPTAIAVRMVKELHQSISLLVQFIEEHPQYTKLDYITGTTMLHRATEKTGFISVKIKPPWLRQLIQWYESIILWLYHPAGSQRFSGQKNRLEPRFIVMHKETLFQNNMMHQKKSLQKYEQQQTQS